MVASAAQAVLDAGVLLEQRQADFTQHGEILGRVPLAASALVIVKGCFQHPVARVVDTPSVGGSSVAAVRRRAHGGS